MAFRHRKRTQECQTWRVLQSKFLLLYYSVHETISFPRSVREDMAFKRLSKAIIPCAELTSPMMSRQSVAELVLIGGIATDIG